MTFCVICKSKWHANQTCDDNMRAGKKEDLGYELRCISRGIITPECVVLNHYVCFFLSVFQYPFQCCWRFENQTLSLVSCANWTKRRLRSDDVQTLQTCFLLVLSQIFGRKCVPGLFRKYLCLPPPRKKIAVQRSKMFWSYFFSPHLTSSGRFSVFRMISCWDITTKDRVKTSWVTPARLSSGTEHRLSHFFGFNVIAHFLSVII